MDPYPIRACSPDDSQTLFETIREAFLDVAERFGLNCQNSPRHPSNCRPDWMTRDLNRPCPGPESRRQVLLSGDVACIFPSVISH